MSPTCSAGLLATGATGLAGNLSDRGHFLARARRGAGHGDTPTVIFLVLVVAATVATAIWSRFVRWERTDRREFVAAFVFGTVLVDLLLYPSQNDVPRGLFRPVVAGQSFRLSELLITLALLARLSAGGGPKRVTNLGLAWAAFSAWYVAAGVHGVFEGNDVNDVLFQVKAVIYIGGGLALAAGLRPSRLVTPAAFGRWIVGVGVAAVAMFPITLGSSSLSFSLPGLSLPDFGEIGPDASSALVVIGSIVLLVEACRRRRRGLIALAALPMVGSVFAGTQRAAIIGLAATAVLLVAAAVGPTWRLRLRTTPTSVFLALGLAAVLATGFALYEVRKGERLPVVDVYEDAFLATKKQQSADVRVILWREARERFDERPFIGHGLGVPFEVAPPNTETVIDSGFHNIGWDLLARTGIVGLVLFTVAIGMTIREGLLGWRRHADPRVAALALGATIGVGSLLTKGMFEDLFEKHRLATLLGLLLGVMVAIGRTVREGTDVDEDVEVVPEAEPGRTGRTTTTKTRVAAWS